MSDKIVPFIPLAFALIMILIMFIIKLINMPLSRKILSEQHFLLEEGKAMHIVYKQPFIANDLFTVKATPDLDVEVLEQVMYNGVLNIRVTLFEKETGALVYTANLYKVKERKIIEQMNT